MSAPPDCAEWLAEVACRWCRAAELIAAQFDKLARAAEGCDALVASALMPAVAGARSVAEKLRIRSVHVSGVSDGTVGASRRQSAPI